MVAYGKLAAFPRSVCESVLKKLDLPTLGRPTIPIYPNEARSATKVVPIKSDEQVHLEIVSRSSENDFLLLDLLLWRHLAFLIQAGGCGERRPRMGVTRVKYSAEHSDIGTTAGIKVMGDVRRKANDHPTPFCTNGGVFRGMRIS